MKLSQEEEERKREKWRRSGRGSEGVRWSVKMV
jgi:hypothetical protein